MVVREEPALKKEDINEIINAEIIRGTQTYPNNLALNNIKEVLAEFKFERRKEFLTRAFRIWDAI